MTTILVILFWLAFLAGFVALDKYGTYLYTKYYVAVVHQMPAAYAEHMNGRIT